MTERPLPGGLECRFQPNLLKRLDIPTSVATGLRQTPLPCEVEEIFRSVLLDLDTAGHSVLAVDAFGITIGTIVGAEYRLAFDNGSISLLDRDSGDVRFVNSGLEPFATFLWQIKATRETMAQRREVLAESALVDFQSYLKRLDPRAFENEDDVWPMMFEEMRLGLF